MMCGTKSALKHVPSNIGLGISEKYLCEAVKFCINCGI